MKKQKYYRMSQVDEQYYTLCHEKHLEDVKIDPFLCFRRRRCQRLEASQSGTKSQLSEDEKSDHTPLYYILSEVGSDDMDTKSELELIRNKRKLQQQASPFRRLRRQISGFCKGLRKPRHLEIEHIYEVDLQSNSPKLDESFLQVVSNNVESTTNGFMTLSSEFPTQCRLDHASQITLYPSFVHWKLCTLDSGNQDDLLRESSVDTVYAQLAIPMMTNRKYSQDRSVLGVAFPHPAVNSSRKRRRSHPILGIQTGHPNWIEKENNNIWELVESDPLEETISSPPSPVEVETSSVVEDTWDNSSSANNSNSPSFREEEWNSGTSTLPSMWTDKVYKPMCQIAREFTACQCDTTTQSIDDVPFEDEPVDTNSLNDPPFNHVLINYFSKRYNHWPQRESVVTKARNAWA